VGDLNFISCQQQPNRRNHGAKGNLNYTLLALYNKNAIGGDLAVALSITALAFFGEEIKNETDVFNISGRNIEIIGIAEIKEHAMLYVNLKYYFTVK
jgi:threonine dehydratase